ncbi:glycosyltransferase family 2 protein [Marinobacter sp. Z-F4-2]|nr:glycosyltransferase family 2 protein [Marinobacter sp. Z-F4-2]
MSADKEKLDCCCILITFNPMISLLGEVLDSILVNRVGVVIVDNGSENVNEIIELCPESKVIPLGQNKGIGFAQNIGIKEARSKDYSYIWLSDQDTLYECDFALKMLRYANSIDEKFAVLGPAYVDLNREEVQPFVRLSKGFEYFYPVPGLNECSHLISSGMVIPVDILDAVGGMREDFFIDYVDFEWCWRAYFRGYKVYGIGDVLIRHTIGEDTTRVLGRSLSIRSPFRHYFIVRNATYLFLYYRVLGFRCKVKIIYQAFAISLVAILFGKKRIKYIKSICYGFFSGLIGRLS